jgi:hypothetical protein
MALTRIKVLDANSNININSANIVTTLTVSGNLVAGNVSTTSSGGSVNVPKISSIAVTNSSFVANGWQAVSNTGGYIVVNGSGFVSGAVVLIGTKLASATTFVNNSLLRVQVPAQVEGTYPVYVTNPDGGVAINVPGLNYSPTPVWTSSSTLPSGIVGSAISIQLTATDTTTVSYSLASGSTLPTGLSLSSTGLLSGTVTGISGTTVYTFTVNAVDTYNQNTSQTFSITISFGDTYFPYTSLLLSASTNSANTSGTSNANTVIDSSYNYNNITRAGNPGQGTFSPFGTTWSNYFGGTGNYLQTNSTPISTSLSTFTVEAWVYMTATPVGIYGAVIGDMQATISGSNYWSFGVNSSNQIAFYWYSGTGNNVTGSTTMSLNTWYHIAISVNTNTISMYVNGVAQTLTGTTTLSNRSGTLTYLVSGQYNGATSGLFTGYISNLRVVTGTALYSSTFTPPTAPLSVIANTGLLTCQSNRFIDANTTPTTITANTTGAMSVQRFNPFGVNGVPYTTSANTYIGSTYFNGSTDYISSPSNAGFTLGTGDFSIELWMYSNDVSTAQKGPFQISANSGGLFTTYTGGITLIQGANGAASLAGGLTINLNGSYISAGSTAVITTGQWYHIAIVRSGSTVTLYLNGINIASGTNAGNITGTYLALGGYYSTSYLFNGYISNFKVVKGTAVYTANFTPPTGPLSVSTNTSILTAQSTQTVTYDANTTPNSLTVTGTPRPTKNNPYPPIYPAYFGSTPYIAVTSNDAFTFGLGNFTLETWLYPTDVTSEQNIISNISTGSQGNTTWSLNYGATFGGGNAGSGNVAFCTWAQTIVYGAINNNKWNHVAVTRSGQNFALFVNGVRTSTYTDTTNSYNFSLVNLANIGQVPFGGARYMRNGYLSNLRVVKGVAVYDPAQTSITVPTGPLSVINNTTMLALGTANVLYDSAQANNISMSLSNSVPVANPGYSPFYLTDTSTAVTTYSGSYYFNGSTDWLSIPSTSNLAFGSGDFCVEMWYYPPTIAQAIAGLFSNSAGAGGGDAQFEIQLATSSVYYPTLLGWSTTFLTSSTGSSFNAWNHLVVCRSGTTLSMFLNGTRVATTTTSNNFSSTNPFFIGRQSASTSTTFTGYISNLRAVKGSSVYTPSQTTITVPTTPLLPSANIAYSGPANTVLLLSGTNVGAYDSTMINDFVNIGGISVNSNVKQYGTNSYYFNGSSYLYQANSVNLQSGTGDFTLESWIYPTNASGTQTVIEVGRAVNGTTPGFQIDIISGVFYAYYGSTIASSITGSSASNGTWYHVAVSRASGSLRFFINGTQVGSTGTDNTNYTQGYLWIGANPGGSSYFTGYLQDVRFTRYARYTSNFTPQASAFATQ